MRLTVRALAEIELHPSKKIFVKLNKYRFPKIIPDVLCEQMLAMQGPTQRWLCIISVLTVISVFRVLPTQVKPDYSTITDPFIGVSDTLSSELIDHAVKVLKLRNRSGFLDFRLKGSMKAGPNGRISMMSFALDALAFIHNPRNFISFVMFNIRYYGFLKGMF
jgi:hypothetical protein